MAYADLASVKARAGALAGGWTDTSRPANDDIEAFIEDVAAELDALIAARGYALPAADSAAALALRGVNADGALVLALEATYPESSGPGAAVKTIDDARARYENARAQIEEGVFSAFALLESGSAAPSASSFWQSEGDSFGTQSTPDPRDANAFTSAGPVGRGQRF